MKIQLSTRSINEAIKKLQIFETTLKELDNDIVVALSEFVEDEINKNYQNTPFRDGNDSYNVISEISDNKAKVYATGTQVLYDEFGTGEVGKNSPHPLKGSITGLKDYNSGKTIRVNHSSTSTAAIKGIPVDGKYWTYKDESGKHYTQGIPAGLQVFNASIALRNKKTAIIKKVIGDALSKL